MKRMISLLLVLAMILCLCACSKTGKDAPSDELLWTDMEDALVMKNSHATLTELEIIKSLTEEGRYEATLTLTAQTKYADWTYEADVSYRKYDQGWAIDDVAVSDGSWQIARMPQKEDMADYAQELLYRMCIDSFYVDALVSDSFDIISDSSQVSDTIIIYYETYTKCLHAEEYTAHEDVWGFEPTEDQWLPASGTNPDDYEVIHSNSYVIDLDITTNLNGQYGNVTISNFTGDSFDASWFDETYHFTYDCTTANRWYVSEDGTDAWISFGISTTEIAIGELKKGDRVLSYEESDYYANFMIR